MLYIESILSIYNMLDCLQGREEMNKTAWELQWWLNCWGELISIRHAVPWDFSSPRNYHLQMYFDSKNILDFVLNSLQPCLIELDDRSVHSLPTTYIPEYLQLERYGAMKPNRYPSICETWTTYGFTNFDRNVGQMLILFPICWT